ncbi:MAG: toll/interleukin-1 receptor domain-containing protein, partial [Woeseiaceae bacterium]
MADEFKYKAFISYSHSDEKWAAWLHKGLETYKPPKSIVGNETPMGKIPSRLSPVFRDRDELPSATNLGELLTESLRRSATQIVICSPAAA